MTWSSNIMVLLHIISNFLQTFLIKYFHSTGLMEWINAMIFMFFGLDCHGFLFQFYNAKGICWKPIHSIQNPNQRIRQAVESANLMFFTLNDGKWITQLPIRYEPPMKSLSISLNSYINFWAVLRFFIFHVLNFFILIHIPS